LTGFDDPILDVGCGAYPARLAMLDKVGFRNLLGIEPFVEADMWSMGVRVKRGYLTDVDGTFRLIMFHHSLEHVPDPYRTMQAARDRIDPAGRVLIRTPIIGGALWRRYGTDWAELDAPRHLEVFSLDGLEYLAARTGFEVLKVTFDSSMWEFIASEQYRRDLAMFEPGSWFEDSSASDIDDATVNGYRAEAEALNRDRDGGRAAIWLRPIG
jgi:SAM-dependent methyltransferase